MFSQRLSRGMSVSNGSLNADALASSLAKLGMCRTDVSRIPLACFNSLRKWLLLKSYKKTIKMCKVLFDVLQFIAWSDSFLKSLLILTTQHSACYVLYV